MRHTLIAIIVTITGLLSTQIHAQVTCTAKAPGQVSVGQAFYLTFELNEKADKLPAINFTNFKYAGGPNTEVLSNISIVNGSMSSVQVYRYTYTLIAEKEGTFTLPAVTFSVKNQSVKSNSLSIAVTASAAPSQNQQTYDNRQSTTVQGFNKEDFFIKAFVSNASPYVGEQVIVSYKLYLGPQTYGYRNQITSRPIAQGFWTYDLESKDENAGKKEEIIDGKKFTVIDMFSMVVFPQKSGKLTISPLETDMIIQVVVQQQQRQRSNDIFDLFFSDPFSGGNRVQNMELKLSSNPVTIQATDLPKANQPYEFSELVGDFKLSAKLSRDKLAAHDAANLTVTISGSGNLQYIEPLNFSFPSDIAVHDPVIRDNINVSSSGVSGSRTFEYVLIPEVEGDYIIPSASFSYFDKRKKSYITLNTPEFTLAVEKGQASNTVSFSGNKTDIKVLGSDIHHIKMNRDLQKQQAHFFLSPVYWIALFLPVMLLALFIILFRKKIESRKNIVLLRDKKASKTAKKRLRKAEKLLHGKQDEAFYIEISKVLWGYISDKFHIPLGQLSLESAYQKLSERNMREDSINEFIHTLQDCEYVRFSPFSDITPDKMYERTFNFITKIERELKNT